MFMPFSALALKDYCIIWLSKFEGLMLEGRKCTFCSFEKIEVKGFGQSELFFGTTYSIEI